jgi:hypothetical protein
MWFKTLISLHQHFGACHYYVFVVYRTLLHADNNHKATVPNIPPLKLFDNHISYSILHTHLAFGQYSLILCNSTSQSNVIIMSGCTLAA